MSRASTAPSARPSASTGASSVRGAILISRYLTHEKASSIELRSGEQAGRRGRGPSPRSVAAPCRACGPQAVHHHPAELELGSQEVIRRGLEDLLDGRFLYGHGRFHASQTGAQKRRGVRPAVLSRSRMILAFGRLGVEGSRGGVGTRSFASSFKHRAPGIDAADLRALQEAQDPVSVRSPCGSFPLPVTDCLPSGRP